MTKTPKPRRPGRHHIHGQNETTHGAEVERYRHLGLAAAVADLMHRHLGRYLPAKDEKEDQ